MKEEATQRVVLIWMRLSHEAVHFSV
jgi:hypothetical protein